MAAETKTYTLTTTDTATVTCCDCGLTFVVPGAWDREKRESHSGFYCPNGHSLVYKGKTKAEREAERYKADAEFYRDRAESERRRRETAERSRAATKGVLTRTKNRIAKGVCPCCNRTFRDLAAHMAGQHPEYAAPVEDA